MKYYMLNISTSKAGIELLTALLDEMGITGAVISDPDDAADILANKEKYKWDYADEDALRVRNSIPMVTIYFESSSEGKKLMSDFRQRLIGLQKKVLNGDFGSEAGLGPLQVETRVVNDDAWKDKWKEHFRPSQITERIAVKPVWEEYEAPEGVKVIDIDPGMAFGTGNHATTRGCIKLLEKYVLKDDRKLSVLDVGCGSGILGIAADALGCGEVLGIEVDEDAVKSAEENVKRNCSSGNVRIVKGDFTEGIEFKADIVLANLTINLIELLTADVGRCLNEGGIYICSGILEEQKEQAEKILNLNGFSVLDTLPDGEWITLAAEKENS